MWIISGLMASFVTFKRATEGYIKKEGKGFVGLPGLMYKVFPSHFMLELCVCP